MKNTITAYIFVVLTASLLICSCSKPAEFQIDESDLLYLSTFVDEANEFAEHYEELEGPKGSEIFGNYKNAVCGNEHDFVGPCIWAIDDIIEAIGYEDIEKVNTWMLDAGSVLYKIKQNNPDFEDTRELMTEVACAIDPGILTRNSDPDCYKVNVVSLLKGALDGASSHATYYVNNTTLERDQLYLIGSSFYKIWRYMVNLHNCL